ncbi:MAG TPA: hypothetical protein VEK84_11380 [Terriglobales bacterium]|nr:hypothetical protein [Terriglobales bacterium]
MNSRIKKSFSGTKVRFWLPRLLAFGLLGLGFASGLIVDEQDASPDLTVHEWGTFTAIAGKDGHAVEWTPLTPRTDLPGFVEHFSDLNFKLGLRGTIRMETPVVYFYSPRDVTVSVRVAFTKGVITEWYPRASLVQPSGPLRNTNLSQLQTDGSITWNGVAVFPNLSGEFPREVPPNRYYTARETSSAPLRVTTPAGDQQEKFLFYRGVSASRLPLTAKLDPAGRLVVRSLSEDEIPAIILFERRGERVGFRLAGALTGETVLDPPVLTGTVDALGGDLEGILVDQGLYPDEARAMVETWRNSWFEEGSRLIYIVPRSFIDHVLPLNINPSPGQMVRAFVGRLEIVTPATARAVATAVVAGDETTLSKYGRFLGPILQTVKEEYPQSTRERRSGH